MLQQRSTLRSLGCRHDSSRVPRALVAGCGLRGHRLEHVADGPQSPGVTAKAGQARRGALTVPHAFAETAALATAASPLFGPGPYGPVALTFTPYHALLGGLILGASTAGKLLTTGRILGISGAIKGLVNGDFAKWRLAFLGGMTAGAVALRVLMPGAFEALRANCPWWRAAIAGLLVGMGSSMGNGCTSGHGICGMARLSPRSFAYVATFMATGFAAATLTQSCRCAGVLPTPPPLVMPTAPELSLGYTILGGTVAAFLLIAALGKVFSPKAAAASAGSGLGSAEFAGGPGTAAFTSAGAAAGAVCATPAPMHPVLETTAEAVAGFTFALGLGFSGMAHATKVVSFLSPLYPAWDLSLPFVLGGAVAVAMVAFQAVIRFHAMAAPLLCPKFNLPSSNAIDTRLIVGGVMFGAGWGMSGVCPGPAMLNAVVNKDPRMVVWMGCLLVGMALESHKMHTWFTDKKK